APLDVFALQPVERDDGVDEAHVARLLGGVGAAEEPDLARLLLADDAGEVARAVARVEGADLRAGLHEAGVLAGDGEVADDVEDVAAADGPAVDGGDDGLRELPDAGLEVEHVEA